MSKSKYKSYPKEDSYRGGCKVAWNTYADKAKAEECAKAARHNAELQLAAGYDFGYCSPGSIRVTEDGKYEVCLP